MSSLKASLGFKGERGYSAYEVAVNNGYIGTETDWLATLGTANTFSETKNIYTATEDNQTEIDLPSAYTDNGFLSIYVEGEKLRSDEYEVNTSEQKIVFTNGLDNGAYVETVILTAATNNLPIVETINSSSINTTVPGTKAVYELVNPISEKVEEMTTGKFDASNIAVITGNTGSSIDVADTLTVESSYPDGFSQSNTIVISKLVSANSNYYDMNNTSDTSFPYIQLVTLTETGIRITMKNNSTSQAVMGYYKIGLMKVGD